jgi:hypothetical protein
MSESLAAFLAGLRGVLVKLGTPTTAPAAPMPSASLGTLERGLTELAGTFLPKVVINSPSEYSSEELVLARAYILFAHAQLEEYLEEIARQRATATLELAKQGQIGGAVAALLAFHGDKQGLPKDFVKYKERSQDSLPSFPKVHPDIDRLVLSQIKVAVDAYNNAIEKNHGVKGANLVTLFAPLGVSPLQMDPLWVAAMDAFGSLRGSHAHSGLSAVSNVSDPFAAQAQLRSLIEGLPGSSGAEGGRFLIYSLRSLDAFVRSK